MLVRLARTQFLNQTVVKKYVLNACRNAQVHVLEKSIVQNRHLNSILAWLCT